MTAISPFTLVGGFVNGIGRLPLSPAELQDTPNKTQDTAAKLIRIAFISRELSLYLFNVNF